MTNEVEADDGGAEAVAAALLNGVPSTAPVPLHPRGRPVGLKPPFGKLPRRHHLPTCNVQQRQRQR